MVVYNKSLSPYENFQTFHPDCHIFAVKTNKKEEDYFSITLSNEIVQEGNAPVSNSLRPLNRSTEDSFLQG